jgi:hypothetical protein
MQSNRKLTETTLLVAVLLTSLLCVGGARAQAQYPVYVGKFTLPYQVVWGKSVLHPGNYTITIKSTRAPIIAVIRNSDGDAVTNVVSGARNGNTDGVNALLIKEKDGKFRVHSLALADLGMVLIYDPSLAHETLEEARGSQTITVKWAKN